MTSEKMTVHKALAEMKIIDSRIQKAVQNAHFVHSCKNGVDKINGMAIDEYWKDIESSYQKVTDLIKRRNAMKRAIVLSNAVTKVVVGDKEYTVAEAIDMKNHGMDGLKYLLREMVYQYNEATTLFNNNSGDALEDKANQYVMNILKSQGDSTDKSDSKQIQALHDSYIANNEFKMIDPLDIAKEIEKIDNMIDEFNAEIDSALSVSNALTVIEFEY